MWFREGFGFLKTSFYNEKKSVSNIIQQLLCGKMKFLRFLIHLLNTTKLHVTECCTSCRAGIKSLAHMLIVGATVW